MTPQQAIQQLQQIAKQSPEAMKKAELIVANNIAVTAIGLVPENTSKLVSSIGITQANGVGVEVGAPYAPYVEFGTGPYAADYVNTLPDEWKAEAERFFINGLGHTKPHPFFYPAVQQHQNDIYEEVDKELSKLIQQ